MIATLPVKFSERREAIGRYVSARLASECTVRGRAAEIARQTGFTQAHISLVRDGERKVGDDLAHALAALWGMSYAALEELASGGRPPPSAPSENMPDLKATLEWCRGSYPDAYLDEYERRARALAEDRPRKSWAADIEARFWEWERTRRNTGPGAATQPRPYGRSGRSAGKGSAAKPKIARGDRGTR